MLKDFSNDLRLVNEANDSHFARALGADKSVSFVDFSDKVRTLSVCLINPRFEPSYWGLDYALPLYPGDQRSTMINGALPYSQLI